MPSSAQDGSQTPAIGVANVYPYPGGLPGDTYRDQDAAVKAGTAEVGGLNFGSPKMAQGEPILTFISSPNID